MEDGGRFGRGPTQLTLAGPTDAPGAPGPGTEEVDCAAGLLAGREEGVDIWFCYRGSNTKHTFNTYLKKQRNYHTKL